MILAAALAALSTIAPGPASGLSAYGGKAVWEQRQADGTFVLVADDGGTVADLPVAASRKRFGADLGPGPAGGVSAVYERCASTCRAYRFDFATMKETRIHAPVPRGCRIRALSIWGGELAATTAGCGRSALYVRTGGHTRRFTVSKQAASWLYDVEAGPHSVAWFTAADDGEGPDQGVRVADLRRGGRTRTIWSTGPSGDSEQEVASLAFAGSRLSFYWSVICDGCDPPDHVVGVDAATGRHERSQDLPEDPAHVGATFDSIAAIPGGVLFSAGGDVLDQPLAHGV
jgi:hypothetical protein